MDLKKFYAYIMFPDTVRYRHHPRTALRTNPAGLQGHLLIRAEDFKAKSGIQGMEIHFKSLLKVPVASPRLTRGTGITNQMVREQSKSGTTAKLQQSNRALRTTAPEVHHSMTDQTSPRKWDQGSLAGDSLESKRDSRRRDLQTLLKNRRTKIDEERKNRVGELGSKLDAQMKICEEHPNARSRSRGDGSLKRNW
ncbi:hypothetical protein K469DRAFT_685144 [Zopfia rhizophila CBS 207.26]|uniref:Uncharacterized protein n=1 Tax=Zopfia rhizophila CBS 207.26 TaxID=1314779 RepID=A0A6A6D9R3_9PEZI|nr:hypothetical protein K469DRAFT_685144 [Zopfia rhizophila CBS 207.26]